jgi:hypothetical protein
LGNYAECLGVMNSEMPHAIPKFRKSAICNLRSAIR